MAGRRDRCISDFLTVPAAGKAIVVGAGIAGFAAAHVLGDLGFEVRLLERDSVLRSEGAGLSLWPNATRALEEIGLGRVLEGAEVVERAAALTPAGEVVSWAPLERIGERVGPLLAVHRGELLAALRDAVEVPVELGVGVRLDGGALWADGQRLRADLIVGADGIRSAVRGLVAPGFEPRPAGYGAWRGVAATGSATPDRASETMGRGRRFGLVPIGGGRTYWFAALAGSRGGEDLGREFDGWHPPIAEVLVRTPAAARSYLPIEDLPRLPRWHRGHVLLLGDAAHAMTPNLGQGAAQALQDVAALRRALAAAPLAEALRGWEGERKRRAERVVARSRVAGRLAQAANPLAAAARDLVGRRTPSAVVARQMEGVMR